MVHQLRARSPAARQVVTAALEVLVEARPSLAHWWCYQSNRDMDQRNPQRMDIDLQRDPDLTQLVVDANRRLQMQMMGFATSLIRQPRRLVLQMPEPLPSLRAQWQVVPAATRQETRSASVS